MKLNRNLIYITGYVVILLIATACTAGMEVTETTEPAGFFDGLWHGFISWIMLVVGLFDSCVRVYEVFNNGTWYDFGFLLGVTFFAGVFWYKNRKK